LSNGSENDTTNASTQGSDTDTLDAFDLAVDERLGDKAGAPDHSAADGDGAKPGSTESEGKPGSAEEGEAGKKDQAAAPAPAQTQSDDIWANAPPEVREAYQREQALWQHRLASTTGRLSAADRELARLRKERETAPQGQQAGNEGQPAAQADSPFASEKIKKLKEEYGEIADPILGLIEDQARELAALKAPVAEVAQQRDNTLREREIETFIGAHPDWERYVNDERYLPWLDAQPKAVQEAAQRAINVEDGQEAAWLLGQFKAFVSASAPAPQTTPSQDPRRQRQLAAGRDGGMTAAPTLSGVPDDFDAAADAAIAAKERQRSRGF
jgi:hypothetical protein